MKAMLYADWMNLRRSMKAILIVEAVIAVASLTWANNASFVSFILVMLSLMVPATLMSSDRAYGWDKLSLSLPISRKDVVSSKFVLCLLVNLVTFLLGTAYIASMDIFYGNAMAENIRFGPDRGRYFLIGVVWVPIILLTVVKKHPAFNKLVQALGGMDSWSVGQLTAFFGGLVIVGAIVYAVCWRIGVGIYRKREL